VGLVGCGRWGRLILRDLRALGAEVTVADPDPAARQAALAAGARAAVSDAALLPDVDGVVVATPASTHAEAALSLLPRGVPVLVEKPMATSVADAERLVAAGGDRLFVLHVWRYHPGVRLLGRMARRGELGRLLGMKTVRANWRSPRTDVDTIWNMAPHDLSLAIAILGEIPPIRFAQAEVAAEGAVGMWAVLGTAPWFVIEVSNRYRDKRREVRLHCERGVCVLPDLEGGHLEVTRDGERTVPFDSRTERRPYPARPALLAGLGWFVAHLDGGAPMPTTGREGLAVVKAVVELRERAGLDGP